jgi:oxygen-dependent protoporphyrinogen oxidase
MHGVYAGDVYQLSAKSLFATAWHLEGKYGSILWGMVRMNQDDQRNLPLVPWHPWDWDQYRDMKEELNVDDEFIKQLLPRKTSTFTFKNGMQSLVKKLEANLKETGTVDFLTDTRIEKYAKVPGSDQIEVITTVCTPCYSRLFTDYLTNYAL